MLETLPSSVLGELGPVEKGERRRMPPRSPNSEFEVGDYCFVVGGAEASAKDDRRGPDGSDPPGRDKDVVETHLSLVRAEVRVKFGVAWGSEI